MREKNRHRFVVGCRGCQRELMAIDRLRSTDVRHLEAHIRTCAASVPLPRTATLEDVLRRVQILDRA